MKTTRNILAALCIAAFISACETDEGKLPAIAFKTGAGYVSADDTIAGDSAFVIGITAAKTEDDDVLKKFNISKSIDGGTATTIVDQSLSGAEKDKYTPDYPTKLDTVHNRRHQYIFTVTNRDGLMNKVSLTLTVR